MQSYMVMAKKQTDGGNIMFTKLMRKLVGFYSRGNGHCDDGDGKPKGSGHCS